MPCDLCGSDEELYATEIEGTRLNVCKSCSQFGKVIKKTTNIEIPKRIEKTKIMQEEIVQVIVENCSSLIKKKREALGLKQKELAKKIAEKESVIHKLESGAIEPNISLARKLEKALSIRLLEEEKIEKTAIKPKTKDSGVTIGDMLNLKS